VRVVKDGRGRRAAKLIRDGRGQVQEVTYSFTGGHWRAALRMRVLPAALTQPTRHRTTTRAASVGVDAGMGRHFATLGQPPRGVSDSHGHIDAPMFLRRACKDLALAARKLEATEAGSRRHAKALVRVQRLHGRAAAGRKTRQQHLSLGWEGRGSGEPVPTAPWQWRELCHLNPHVVPYWPRTSKVDAASPGPCSGSATKRGG
jgi:hypothetical protein